MKKILKYILMIVLITLIVYLVLTSIRLYKWSTDNQFNIFNDKSLSNQIDNLNESKIRGIGANVQSSIDLNFNNGKDEQYSVGFAVWRQTQYWLGQIFAWNIEISFIIGLAIVIGYLILKTKWNVFIKIFFGYLVQFILFTSLYILIMSSYIDTVKRDYGILSFFIIYSLVFAIMYFAISFKNRKKCSE